MYLLVLASVLLIAPTFLFGSVYLWSRDPGRRGRAWNLLRLLQRAKRQTRDGATVEGGADSASLPLSQQQGSSGP